MARDVPAGTSSWLQRTEVTTSEHQELSILERAEMYARIPLRRASISSEAIGMHCIRHFGSRSAVTQATMGGYEWYVQRIQQAGESVGTTEYRWEEGVEGG